MQPFLRFRCPGCRAGIKAPRQLRGQIRSCPGCGQSFLVREQPPDDMGPLLLVERECPVRLRPRT